MSRRAAGWRRRPRVKSRTLFQTMVSLTNPELGSQSQKGDAESECAKGDDADADAGPGPGPTTPDGEGQAPDDITEHEASPTANGHPPQADAVEPQGTGGGLMSRFKELLPSRG